MTPIRIQRSRQHKQVSPNGLPIKYVGRPTKWGNPYRVVKGDDGLWNVWSARLHYDIIEGSFNSKNEALKCCLLRYRSFLEWKIKFDFINIDELRGYNLSCWCPLDEPCHVDVLFELLNQKS